MTNAKQNERLPFLAVRNVDESWATAQVVGYLSGSRQHHQPRGGPLCSWKISTQTADRPALAVAEAEARDEAKRSRPVVYAGAVPPARDADGRSVIGLRQRDVERIVWTQLHWDFRRDTRRVQAPGCTRYLRDRPGLWDRLMRSCRKRRVVRAKPYRFDICDFGGSGCRAGLWCSAASVCQGCVPATDVEGRRLRHRPRRSAGHQGGGGRFHGACRGGVGTGLDRRVRGPPERGCPWGRPRGGTVDRTIQNGCRWKKTLLDRVVMRWG